MNRIIFLAVLLLTAASSQQAQADDVVTQSCAALAHSADVAADRLYDEIVANRILVGPSGEDHIRTYPPRRLPRIANAFGKLISPVMIERAASIKELRAALAKSPDPKVAAALTTALASAEDELFRAVGHAEHDFKWEDDDGDGHRYVPSRNTWDPKGLRYEVCGMSATIGAARDNEHAVCAVLDLVSGETSYVIDSRTSFLAGTPLVDLGKVEPVDAHGDLVMQAIFHMQLHQGQFRTLPDECRQTLAATARAEPAANAKAEADEDDRGPKRTVERDHGVGGGHAIAGQQLEAEDEQQKPVQPTRRAGGHAIAGQSSTAVE